MQNLTPPNSTYASPKRKRDSQDLFSTSPPPVRLKTTNLPTRPLFEDDLSPHNSPRTAVASNLADLHLADPSLSIKLDFDAAHESQMGEKTTFNAGRNQLLAHPAIHHLPTPQQSSTPSQPKSPPVRFQIPETPHREPTPPPPSSHPTSASQLPTILSPDPNLTNPPQSGPFKSPAPISPPASDPTLWWTPPEITGHSPSDPSDDGRGINGVGFVPTPAMASARAERRRKQVREWKEREGREERRRRGLVRGRMKGDEEMEKKEGGGGRKVRFLEV